MLFKSFLRREIILAEKAQHLNNRNHPSRRTLQDPRSRYGIADIVRKRVAGFRKEMFYVNQQAMLNKNRLLFIVNKDPLVGNFLKYQLVGAGYKETVVFQSAKECLYVLRKGTIPAFIVADYDLDSMNGDDFLKTVLDSYPDIRILFFSSVENHEIASQLILSGASDFIHKTTTSTQAVSELIKNLRYLEKEITHIGY